MSSESALKIAGYYSEGDVRKSLERQLYNFYTSGGRSYPGNEKFEQALKISIAMNYLDTVQYMFEQQLLQQQGIILILDEENSEKYELLRRLGLNSLPVLALI
ncbi:MAG TPA: hypothetical protein PK957_03880 [Candidatus Dojkabacteria bacterium]|nr:hypothetical protein [Candidatus Dojkabacteria bacterium]